jgi:capsular polysaccharide biosynthesis protein
MISYQQSSVLALGMPKIFGANAFFQDFALHRPRRKAGQFALRVFRSRIAATGSGFGFSAAPEPMPLTSFEPAENLEHRGLEVQDRALDSVIDERLPVYLTIANFHKSVYGHWIADLLPGLFLAKHLLPGLQVRLLHAGPLPPFGLDLLAALGLPEDCLTDASGLDGEAMVQLVSMTPPRQHDYLHEGLLRRHLVPPVRGVAAETASPIRNPLIYVSRRNWQEIRPNGRALTNRDDVESAFARAGYAVFSPEQYSVAEQIAVFRQAAVVAGESGSGLHNSIFMPPGARVICIQSGRQTHLIQASLCDLFGQDCAYVVGQQENADWNANFEASLDDVESAIAQAVSGFI